jgi:hypothetical protein
MQKKYNYPERKDMVEDEKGRKMPKEVYEQKYGQLPNVPLSQKQPVPSQRGRQQTELQVQANLQMADDTWERLIRALERLELVTDDNRPEQSATRANFHKHRSETPESIYDAELEVHLQIKAFSRVVAPVRGDKKTVPYLLKDFICWLGGRERVSPHSGKVDQFAIPTIKSILGGQPLDLPRLDEPTLISTHFSEREMGDVVESIGVGLTEGDLMIDDFTKNPDKQATQHTHIRGTLDEGRIRLEKIARASYQSAWFNRFLDEYWTLIEAGR